MTDRLSLYNGSLNIIGERKLANLTENRESRRKLDDIWDNDLLDRVLQMGQWNFAARSAELQFSPSVTPSFGYQFAFDKPTDFIRTMRVCHDEYFKQPLTQYSDEAKWIFADLETIYLQYVSNDTSYGSDFSLWPQNFTEMVEHYMAYKVAPRLTGIDMDSNALLGKWKMMLREAKAVDAMEQPATFPPKGAWASSRQGFRQGERGKRNQLIG
jgi:hypothetical protein